MKWLKKIYAYFCSRINYESECKKANIAEVTIEEIENIETMYRWRMIAAILSFIVIMSALNIFLGFKFLNPFNQGNKNVQWLGIFFGIVSTILMGSSAFKSSHQIAIETSMFLDGNKTPRQELIKQKVKHEWALFFLFASLFLQISYLMI
jgi:hypothetical protein